jgi:dihydrolipoamide dehydrogenase
VADGLIIATGSSWPNLPLFPIDGTQIITSKQALDLSVIPASLLIVGGGVEGCEFASLYSGLGTQVTLVELVPRLLPLEDEEISQMMERELKKRGVDIRTGVTVDQIVRQPDVVTAHLRDGLSLNVEQVLVSVGRGFNSRGIGLEKAGVQVGARGEIVVNDRMETNVPGCLCDRRCGRQGDAGACRVGAGKGGRREFYGPSPDDRLRCHPDGHLYVT